MNLDKLKNLPLQERIIEFKKIRDKFVREKSKLIEITEALEDAIKEREAFANNLSTPERKALKNEVKSLAISIKNVKARLDAKNQELKLVEQALDEAEQNIVQDEKQLVEIQKQEKTKLELMINELNKREQSEQIRELEEEIKQAEIPEEVKKEIEQSIDYMDKQNENFYKSQMNQFFEENIGSGYQSSQNQEEEKGVEGAHTTFYETDDKGRVRVKDPKEDYKA